MLPLRLIESSPANPSGPIGHAAEESEAMPAHEMTVFSTLRRVSFVMVNPAKCTEEIPAVARKLFRSAPDAFAIRLWSAGAWLPLLQPALRRHGNSGSSAAALHKNLP